MKNERRDDTRSRDLPDRLPPHSTEAEMGVLGCILLDPRGIIPVCQERIREPKEVFYNKDNREIYDALQSLYEEDKMGMQEISDSRNEWLFLVTEELRDRGKLDAVGGSSYLEELMDFSPHPGNIEAYLEVLVNQGVLRNVITGCTDIVQWIEQNRGRAFNDILDKVETEILQLCRNQIEADTSIEIMPAVHEAMNGLEEIMKTGKGKGLKTGFVDFDEKTTGLHGGEMYVIAARPSLGKTSLGVNILENISINNGIPVGMFSLEMKKAELVLRMAAGRAEINSRHLKEGKIEGGEDGPKFKKLTESFAKIGSSPFYIDDTPGLSITQLRGKARRMVVEKGVKVILIDYLQLVQCLGRRYDNNRQQEIADISGGIKALAKELDVPIIVLAQLNRDVEREKRKPRMSDLRESGAIEQDADMIGFLYRPGDLAKDQDQRYEREGEPEQVNLLIAKQRNGPTGEVHFLFTPQFTKYQSKSKVEDADVPPEAQESFEKF